MHYEVDDQRMAAASKSKHRTQIYTQKNQKILCMSCFAPLNSFVIANASVFMLFNLFVYVDVSCLFLGFFFALWCAFGNSEEFKLFNQLNPCRVRRVCVVCLCRVLWCPSLYGRLMSTMNSIVQSKFMVSDKK